MRFSGAIFQSDRYRPLFEDHRARIVGDTVGSKSCVMVSPTLLVARGENLKPLRLAANECEIGNVIRFARRVGRLQNGLGKDVMKLQPMLNARHFRK